MVYRVLLTFVVIAFPLITPHWALAHTPNGNPILDLNRCTPRLTVCQLPQSASNLPEQSDISSHTCRDAIGIDRACALEGPFHYLSLPSDSLEREVEQADPLGFTPCVNGFADIYPCSNVDLLSFLPLAAMGGGNGSDLWGWTDPETGREYVLVGRTRGLSFVDITEPSSPRYLGELPSQD